MFGKAIVFGEHINVIFDTGFKGCAISKQFLDRKKQSINGLSSIKLIDIQGNQVTLLGEKKNIQINIEGIHQKIFLGVNFRKITYRHKLS